MTTTDRAARLAAIRERLAKRTPGEWSLNRRSATCVTSSDERTVCDAGSHYNNTTDDCGRSENMANAAFIAHAPADLTWLLGEVERLTRVREAAAALIAYEDAGPDDGQGGWMFWDAKFDAIRDALEANNGQ